ncbi:MAG: radical SAM protein [Synergistetes bacterium]|nr:radical SAM protein [Synergistota bacterium]
MKVLIFDGYVDEPACFGVSPYISPYPRYIAGVLLSHGIESDYITVDSWRVKENKFSFLNSYDLLIVISGLTVPGRYRGGTPLTLTELESIASSVKRPFKILCGPIKHGYSLKGGKKAVGVKGLSFDLLALGDPCSVLDSYLRGRLDPFARRSYKDLKRWASLGAYIIRLHDRFPKIICEIETGRGCERTLHCSFCTEGLLGFVEYRPPEDVIEEVSSLYEVGCRAFRLGRQPNLFAYMGGERPNVKAVEYLYKGIREVAPEIKVLHMDNANPWYIANFPEESFEIAKVISIYNTAGDTAPLGVESVDPEVIKKNNLKATRDEALKAIEIINKAGGWREGKELPKLLPGVNLLYGLPGESYKTYELNFSFLKEVLDKGFLLRRINIRQVVAFEDTPLYEMLGGKPPKINKRLFDIWKQRVREEIDFAMLKKVAPPGSIIKGVIVEEVRGNLSFGRALGSYPLLVGIPMPLKIGEELDVFVIDYGYRSLTALPIPFKINEAPFSAIEAIPGIGKGRAKRIIQARPFNSKRELINSLDDPKVLEFFLEFLELPNEGN